LKNAQEEFNSARQISLQKQSELQGEVNQLKMSSELKEKDIERLNQVLSAEKSAREVKLQEIQQQLEDTMNELESAKSSQRSLEMTCKMIESERKNMADRLQERQPQQRFFALFYSIRSLLSTRQSDTRARCPALRRRPSLLRPKFPASRISLSRRLRSWTRHRRVPCLSIFGLCLTVLAGEEE
jgi:hypothetical protein